MRSQFFVLTVAMTLAVAGEAPAASGGGDAAFVSKATSGGMMEAELGKYAEAHAANADVKAFGRRMAADHTKANQELADVAKAQKVNVPNSMSAEDKNRVKKLEKSSGANFDREYMRAMVHGHEEAVAAFQKEATEGKTGVDQWAASTLPTLESHLEDARKTAAEVGAKPSAAR